MGLFSNVLVCESDGARAETVLKSVSLWPGCKLSFRIDLALLRHLAPGILQERKRTPRDFFSTIFIILSRALSARRPRGNAVCFH